MKLKIGDKVKVVNAIRGHYPEKGYIGIITYIGAGPWGNGNKDSLWLDGDEKRNGSFWTDELWVEKIGGSMSKHDDLKDRIEGVIAWDKRADEILQEILPYIETDVSGDMPYLYLEIPIRDTHTTANQEIKVRSHYNKNRELRSFSYNSQCEKLQAFKDALMWLLDHSDIKKVDTCKQEKIDKIQKQIDKLQEQLNEL